MKTDELLTSFQHLMQDQALTDKKEWWENYLKHVITFRSVGIPGIRETVKSWYKNEGISDLSLESQLDIAMRLLEEPINVLNLRKKKYG